MKKDTVSFHAYPVACQSLTRPGEPVPAIPIFAAAAGDIVEEKTLRFSKADREDAWIHGGSQCRSGCLASNRIGMVSFSKGRTDLLGRLWQVVLLIGVASVLGAASAQTNGQPAQPRGLRGSYAPIRAGKMAVLGHKPDYEQRFGVVSEVEFKKVNSGPRDYVEAIRGKLGTGQITYVNVPGTLYSVILLNGAVQPLILEVETWEVWEVTGLGKNFSRCRMIIPGEKQMAFGGVEGFADVEPTWHFEFGDKEGGPRVRFTVEGGW